MLAEEVLPTAIPGTDPSNDSVHWTLSVMTVVPLHSHLSVAQSVMVGGPAGPAFVIEMTPVESIIGAGDIGGLMLKILYPVIVPLSIAASVGLIVVESPEATLAAG